MEIEFPEALNFLITESARYKVLYGGRGAGKTENIAVALLSLSITKRLKVACFREFQQSIKESVHAIIKQKIYDLKLETEFDIQETKIICKRNGSEFIFLGLRHNIDSIKSLAKIDIAWVEEARNVSKRSWAKLGPTIRGRHESDPNGLGGPFGEGPEIWVSFNPELEDDETYKQFVLNPPSEYGTDGKRYSIIKKVNHSDNKWFPPDLKLEMEEAKKRNIDEYMEVWEGHTKQVLDGAIYADEIRKVLLDGRRGKVPYDPSRPVYTFWDLGHSDHTAIWFIQRVGMEYNIINYFQNHLKKIEYYLKILQEFNYVYGTVYMPHDAASETLAARSIANITRAAGYKVIIVPRVANKTLGINAVRTVFDLCNFDEENTTDGWQCLTRYCFKINEKNGKFSREPDHDEYSHGSDAFQTFALSLKSETAIKKNSNLLLPTKKIIPFNSSTSWMN